MLLNTALSAYGAATREVVEAEQEVAIGQVEALGVKINELINEVEALADAADLTVTFNVGGSSLTRQPKPSADWQSSGSHWGEDRLGEWLSSSYSC